MTAIKEGCKGELMEIRRNFNSWKGRRGSGRVCMCVYVCRVERARAANVNEA